MKKIVPFFLLTFYVSMFSTYAQPLRVMSFNIRYHNPQDGYDAWPHRKAMVESMIRFYDVDLFGIQEALESQMADLAAMFPDFGYLGSIREPGGEYAAIWYRKSRLRLLESNTFWLSETPDTMSRGWDAALNRVASWGRFQDRKSGKQFLHLNTHFDHRGEVARRESARLILQQLQTLNPDRHPVIVTGDFNATPSSEPYQILTHINDQQALKDAFVHSLLPAHGPASTWSGFRFPGVPERRIDYIFLKHHAIALRHGVLTDSWSGRFPSDHLPVMAEVLLDPPQPLPNAHAHNDYEHARPLLDALAHGFTSVEADVFPVNGNLGVAHDLPSRPEWLPTLEALYLQPLAERVDAFMGGVYPGYEGPFYLMIDIKQDGEHAYAILKEKLAAYAHLLQQQGGPLTIFLSGERPMEAVMNDTVNWVGLDGRPEDLGKGIPAERMPVISQHFRKVVKWNGKGRISPQDRQLLAELVERTHAEGKKLRLWASPETPEAWRTLHELGVDLINTDQLAELAAFLQEMH